MNKNLPGSVLHLVVTGIVGFIFFLIGQVLYPTLTETIWQPLGIALYFLAFAAAMYVTMFILNQMRGDYSFFKRNKKLDDYWSSYRIGALCVAIIFALAGVFEFLYEIGGNDQSPATSYIFVIDDSGSMGTNDSQMQRIDAINTIMSRESPTLPYAVYGFTTDAILLKEMAPYTPTDTFEFESLGGTNILTSLNSVLDDLLSGKVEGGSAPRILLLSDGESSSFGWRRITQDSRKCNATISTVGFGYDSGLLRNIAERTGGVFVQVDDIDDLPSQMETAITSVASRNLISTRPYVTHNMLYAAMRVLFLSIIGLIWSWMKYETYCSENADLNSRVFILSVLFCTLTSILMEVLLQNFWLSPAIARMVFCILWAMTPGFFIEKQTAPAPQREKTDIWGDVPKDDTGLVRELEETRGEGHDIKVLDGPRHPEDYHPQWEGGSQGGAQSESPWSSGDGSNDGQDNHRW